MRGSVCVFLHFPPFFPQGMVDVHARTCSTSDCDISPSPSGLHPPHPPHYPHPSPSFSSVHPLIQNAPIPPEQYLLLGEKKVTRSIISKRTFDLTFTEEAKNSSGCERRSRFTRPVCFWMKDRRAGERRQACQDYHCLTTRRSGLNAETRDNKAESAKWSRINPADPESCSRQAIMLKRGSFLCQ